MSLPVKIELEHVRLINRKSLPGGAERATCDHYEIIYTPNVNPHMIQFTFKADGSVWLVPIQNCAALKVKPTSVPKHQPLGTPDQYDTPSGKKKNHAASKQYKERTSKGKIPAKD